MLKSILSLFLESVKYKISLIYHFCLLRVKYPNCKFYMGAVISNTSFERFNIVFEDVLIDSCKIGAHTYIQKRSSIFNADIGRFCSIASNVSIAPGIHKTDGVSTHPAFSIRNTPLICKFAKKDLFEPFKRVTIGNDVWIGEKAIILDGIVIGSGAIIAAGSVVTKNVDPYAVVGGVPAKVIKYRFNQETILKLLNLKWWDNSDQWLEQNCELFTGPELLINKI